MDGERRSRLRSWTGREKSDIDIEEEKLTSQQPAGCVYGLFPVGEKWEWLRGSVGVLRGRFMVGQIATRRGKAYPAHVLPHYMCCFQIVQ